MYVKYIFFPFHFTIMKGENTNKTKRRHKLNTKTPLELLIVEDDLMNRVGAKLFFDKINNINVDFAQTYQEAQTKLEEKVYALAIIDLNIPEKEGAKPEKLGFKLGKQAGKYIIPYCIFTGGTIGHGDHAQPGILCYPLGDQSQKIEIGVSGKAEPEAWEKAYKILRKTFPLVEEVFAAKLRYKKFGKNYIKR
ncbi:hypothetical protein AYK26_01425 [Euryarchaeota archaeon SM23-78]|nr:MAG: hypothetical protein AYK26_01425 [Euryarchaeota archaeon SM23-78]